MVTKMISKLRRGNIRWNFNFISRTYRFPTFKTTLFRLNRARFAARTFAMDLPKMMVEYDSATHQQCRKQTDFVNLLNLTKRKKEFNTQQQDNKGI